MEKYSRVMSEYAGEEIVYTSTNNLWDLYDTFYSDLF